MNDTKPELNYFGVSFPVKHPKGSCRVCGCTEDRACPGGCWWVFPELCNRCADRVEALLVGVKSRMADFQQVLAAEDSPNVLALALHNACGDWRRAAISNRLDEVRR